MTGGNGRSAGQVSPGHAPPVTPATSAASTSPASSSARNGACARVALKSPPTTCGSEPTDRTASVIRAWSRCHRAACSGGHGCAAVTTTVRPGDRASRARGARNVVPPTGSSGVTGYRLQIPEPAAPPDGASTADGRRPSRPARRSRVTASGVSSTASRTSTRSRRTTSTTVAASARPNSRFSARTRIRCGARLPPAGAADADLRPRSGSTGGRPRRRAGRGTRPGRPPGPRTAGTADVVRPAVTAADVDHERRGRARPPARAPGASTAREPRAGPGTDRRSRRGGARRSSAGNRSTARRR